MKRRQLKKLMTKAMYSEVGFSGHGRTCLDERGVRRYGRLHPRHRGLLKGWIEEVMAVRAAAFRDAVIEVTGEDPETDW